MIPLRLAPWALCAIVTALDLKSDLESLSKADGRLDKRIELVKQLARVQDPKDAAKVVAGFTEVAFAEETPEALRRAMADQLAGMDKKLVLEIVGGKLGACVTTARKIYLMRALREAPDAELDRSILARFVHDEDVEVRLQAIDTLVEHQFVPAARELGVIVRVGKDEQVVAAALVGATKLLEGSTQWDAWEKNLVEFTRSTSEPVRRGALAALARGPKVEHLAAYVTALAAPDWSSRLLAVQALEKLRAKESIPPLIEALRREANDSRLQAELARTLEKLTGMRWGDRVADWDTWWRINAETFVVPAEDAARAPAPPHEGDTHVELPKFYGIAIESKRVLFVVDISGSMKDPMKSPEYEGKKRFEVATSELLKMIDDLPAGSLFNILSFNAGVDGWLDGLESAAKELGNPPGARAQRGPRTGDGREPKDRKPAIAGKPVDPAQAAKDVEKQKQLDEAFRAKARAYVGGMQIEGGTNIHDALELAFEDPLVDTIFLLTDGQPSAGKELSENAIRAAVQRWNETRHVKIHTVSIGEEFPLLQWLAADSGGECRVVK